MIFMLCRFWGCIHGAIIFTFFQLHSCCILPCQSFWYIPVISLLSAKAKVKEKRPLTQRFWDFGVMPFQVLWTLGSWVPSEAVQMKSFYFGSKWSRFFLPFWLTWVLSQCGLDFSEHPESVPLSHGDAVAVAHMEVRCDRGFIGFILNGPFQQIGICDRGQNIMVPCVVTHNDRSLQDSPQDCQRILTVLLSLQWFRAYREEFRIFVAIATCIAAGFIM